MNQPVYPVTHGMRPLSYGEHASRCDHAIAQTMRGALGMAVVLYHARRDLEPNGEWDQFIHERAYQGDVDEKTLRRYVDEVAHPIEEGWFHPQLTISAVINICALRDQHGLPDVAARKRVALAHVTKNETVAALRENIKNELKALPPPDQNKVPYTNKETAAERIETLEASLREGAHHVEVLLGGGDSEAQDWLARVHELLRVG